MAGFYDLGVPPLFLERLGERHVATPTAVQERVIPLIGERSDLVFQAPTGSGKTLAYLLPLLRNLFEDGLNDLSPVERGASGPPSPGSASSDGVQLLILAPTAELASQIKQEISWLLEGSPLRALLCIGGANIIRQITTLKKEKPRIVVGTPERVLHLMQLGKIRPLAIRYVVLDEVDRLLAKDQKDHTTALLARCSSPRQLVACSATILPRVRESLEPYLREGWQYLTIEGHPLSSEGSRPLSDTPTRLPDDGRTLPASIDHWAVFSEQRKKISTLRSVLYALGVTDPAQRGKRQALVFVERPDQIGRVVSQLQYHHIAAGGLFSDMPKQNRKKAINDFKKGALLVLISTDIASRGLDFPNIKFVIELDVPPTTEGYLHRAGRTGRMGKRGIMITIGDERELEQLARLEKKLHLTVYPKVLYQGRLIAPPQSPPPQQS